MHPFICEIRETEKDWEWQVLRGKVKVSWGESGTQEAAGNAAVIAVENLMARSAPEWGEDDG